RNPEKLEPQSNLTPTRADIYHEEEVARSVIHHDAVISAFNPGWEKPDIYDLQVRGMRSIIDGVKRSGVKRLLVVGGAGSLEVSIEDFAMAMIDELEKPAQIRRRFTVGY